MKSQEKKSLRIITKLEKDINSNPSSPEKDGKQGIAEDTSSYALEQVASMLKQKGALIPPETKMDIDNTETNVSTTEIPKKGRKLSDLELPDNKRIMIEKDNKIIQELMNQIPGQASNYFDIPNADLSNLEKVTNLTENASATMEKLENITPEQFSDYSKEQQQVIKDLNEIYKALGGKNSSKSSNNEQFFVNVSLEEYSHTLSHSDSSSNNSEFTEDESMHDGSDDKFSKEDIWEEVKLGDTALRKRIKEYEECKASVNELLQKNIVLSNDIIENAKNYAQTAQDVLNGPSKQLEKDLNDINNQDESTAKHLMREYMKHQTEILPEFADAIMNLQDTLATYTSPSPFNRNAYDIDSLHNIDANDHFNRGYPLFSGGSTESIFGNNIGGFSNEQIIEFLREISKHEVGDPNLSDNHELVYQDSNDVTNDTTKAQPQLPEETINKIVDELLSAAKKQKDMPTDKWWLEPIKNKEEFQLLATPSDINEHPTVKTYLSRIDKDMNMSSVIKEMLKESAIMKEVLTNISISEEVLKNLPRYQNYLNDKGITTDSAHKITDLKLKLDKVLKSASVAKYPDSVDKVPYATMHKHLNEILKDVKPGQEFPEDTVNKIIELAKAGPEEIKQYFPDHELPYNKNFFDELIDNHTMRNSDSLQKLGQDLDELQETNRQLKTDLNKLREEKEEG